MKKLFLICLISCANYIFAQNNIRTIQFDNDIERMMFKISDIDSITYTTDNNNQYQNIWIGEISYKAEVRSVSDVYFVDVPNECVFVEDPENRRCGIISKTGDFCAIIEDTVTSRNLAVFGNLKSNYIYYASIDSLGLVNHISIDDAIFTMFYAENCIALYENGNWVNDIPYEAFEIPDNVSTRASILTRNPIYKLLSVISTVKGYMTKPCKSAIIDLLKSQLGDKEDDGLNLLLKFIDGIDPTDILDVLDYIFDRDFFGDAFIHTLDPVELSMTDYKLGCNFTYPSKDTPFYKSNEYRGISYDFTIGMNLHENILFGSNIYQEKVSLDEEAWFDFNNLNVATSYTFEPRMNVEYSIPYRALGLSIGENPDIICPQKVKKTIYGNPLSFTIPDIGCKVVSASDSSITKVTIECNYISVPDNAECGVEVTCTSTKEVIRVGNGSGKGKRSVTVTGLKPDTEYFYIAYVTYKGKEYISWNGGSFRTGSPSASTGDVSDITVSSAKVKCSYFADEGFECGIMVSSNTGTTKYIASSTEGEQEIILTGLEPYTTYNYWAYVEVNGTPVNGEVKSFKTKLPDISGTWSCTEKYYTGWNYSQEQTKTYSITLHKDGTADVNDGTSYENARWSFSANGKVSISVNVMSTQTQNIGVEYEGTVDDIKNPTKITGGRYSWAFNQVIGYARHDNYHSVILTK